MPVEPFFYCLHNPKVLTEFTRPWLANSSRLMMYIGPIFSASVLALCFIFYVLIHVCKHMFWEKSKQQDSCYVYDKHNMEWNRDLQFWGCLGSQGSREKLSFNLCKFGMLSINMNHNIGFFQWKNAMLQFMFDYMTWIITWI